MERLQLKDISETKTFEKYGDIFTQVRHNPETGWYLYERVKKDAPDCSHYEVVKGAKHTNPDGSVVYAYPSSERWGTNGYTIVKNWYAAELIDFLMGRKSTSAEELRNFKNNLKYPSISRNVSRRRIFD